VVELGVDGKYHAELVYEPVAPQVTIHILDSLVNSNVLIDQGELLLNVVTDGTPRQFVLASIPQPREAAGTASTFQSNDAELSAVLGTAKARCRLSITVDGKQFVGEINEVKPVAAESNNPAAE
jgi:hypothetical protein